MTRDLKVSVARPYGVETIYPECETSRLFARLLGQRTLTTKDIQVIKDLGYKFEVIPRAGERTSV